VEKGPQRSEGDLPDYASSNDGEGGEMEEAWSLLLSKGKGG